MKNIRQNNLIIGSDILFGSRHKSGFYDLFRNEHDIFMLESSKLRNNKDLIDSIKSLLSMDYQHKVFVGVGKDNYFLFDLYLEYGLVFDAAILINGSYSDTIYLDPEYYGYKELSNNLTQKTQIYNLYGKNSKHESLDFATVNQNVGTYIPPQMSSRFSLEAYGLLVYGLYEKTGLENSIGRLSYL